MGRRTFLALAFALVLLASTGAVLFAVHESPQGPSVDGNEIRYIDNTSYDDALSWALLVWNNLDPIDILPDSAFTVADVEVFDINDGNVVWIGNRWVRPGADWIRINNYYAANASTFKKRTVMAHEFGHALGLGDHTLADGTGTNILMYEACCYVNTPQAHDIADYNALWN